MVLSTRHQLFGGWSHAVWGFKLRTTSDFILLWSLTWKSEFPRTIS